MSDFYKRLLDNANDLIWSMNLEGKITYINDKITEWGYDKHELMGQPLLNVLNITHMGERSNENEGKDASKNFEMDVEDRNKKIRKVVVSCSPLHDERGNIVGMSGIVVDVTKNHNLLTKLRHEEKLSSLGRLATGIAHEVRNPLSSIKMNLAILRERVKLNGDDREHFQIAEDSVKTLESIVTEFIDYAKPSPPNLEKNNLHAVMDSTIAMLKHQCNEKEIKIDTSYATNLPMMFFDKVKIYQVLMNILMNAIQASPENSGIEVKTVNGQRNVSIVVSDSGSGISDEDMKCIFDPFFTRKDYGTGLGLCIVHSIITNHKGTIEVRSKENVGTDIIIELPKR